MLPLRIYYGDYYIELWNKTITSLETIDNINDFTDFKYKQIFEQQVYFIKKNFNNNILVNNIINSYFFYWKRRRSNIF